MQDNDYSISEKNSGQEFVLYDEPNKFARPASIEIDKYAATFHGYQEFTLTSKGLYIADIDATLQRKHDLLRRYLDPQVVSCRTVLDLGAGTGYFCFLAMQNGAHSAIALDMDEKYLAMIQRAVVELDIHGITAVHTNVMDWHQQADITISLALIHWIYSCTANYGSLDSAVFKIAQLTGYMAVIEWVEPEDQAIDFFHHLDWNAELISDSYNRSEFIRALNKHFARYELAGNISETRQLFVAFKTPYVINYAGPMPLMLSKERIISSRNLVTYEGTEYWSRVYDAGDSILKQTVLDLAAREAEFLSKYNNEYFPHVYETGKEDGWSFVRMEKIKGIRLSKMLDIADTSKKYYTFIKHCLKLLCYLKEKGITHRDIRMDNIIIRDGKPVLIDFGWAVADWSPYFEPDGLGDDGRPPDGEFDDVYAMGKILEEINDGRYDEYKKVIDMMIAKERLLRINELDILYYLFSIADSNQI